MLKSKLSESHRKTPLFVLLLLLAISAVGCSRVTGPDTEPLLPGAFQLDPTFLSFYDHLGGLERAGPAISAPIKEGDAISQYVEAGKLIYDPNMPVTSKFRLAPLGLEMGLNEHAVDRPQNPDTPYVDGHTIPPDFYELYEDLKPSTVGKPLTEPRFNLVRKRYEQYFENLGFYRNEGSRTVRLLTYGLWTCDENCRDYVRRDSIPDIRRYIAPEFQDFVRMHGTDFTGLALTDLYINESGGAEQILENVVLVAVMQEGQSEVRLRPLTDALQISAEPPLANSFSEGKYFYRVLAELGYEVPLEFWDYIQDHGGIALIGPPITHYSHLENNIYHQCFENLCLTYDPSSVPGARVRPEPLGTMFNVIHYQSQKSQPVVTVEPVEAASTSASQSNPEPETTSVPLPAVPEQGVTEDGVREIKLRVWQRYSVVEPGQRQEIQIWLEEDGQPLGSQVVELTITMPDGSQQRYPMVPTSLSGQSSLLLPEIDAQNGTIVAFKACYTAAEKFQFCDADIFVIWKNP